MISWCPVDNPMIDGSRLFPAEEPEPCDGDCVWWEVCDGCRDDWVV